VFISDSKKGVTVDVGNGLRVGPGESGMTEGLSSEGRAETAPGVHEGTAMAAMAPRSRRGLVRILCSSGGSLRGLRRWQGPLPNGLELSCPAEAGNSTLMYGLMAGETRSNRGAARRVSFSELLGVRTQEARLTYGLI
jgi:hypothetical protein